VLGSLHGRLTVDLIIKLFAIRTPKAAAHIDLFACSALQCGLSLWQSTPCIAKLRNPTQLSSPKALTRWICSFEGVQTSRGEHSKSALIGS